jgi:hypothetical protein
MKMHEPMIAAVYKRAFQLVMNSPLLGAVVAWSLVVQVITERLLGPGEPDLHRWLHVAPLFFVVMLGQIWVSSGLVRVSLATLRGEPEPFMRVVVPARMYFQVLTVLLIMIVPVILGLILLIVPGMILIIMWSQATNLVVDDRSSGRAALTFSSRVTKGFRVDIFAVLLLLALPTLVAGILAALPKPSVPLIAATWLLQAIIAAFSLFVGVSLYEALRERVPERFEPVPAPSAPLP